MGQEGLETEFSEEEGKVNPLEDKLGREP